MLSVNQKMGIYTKIKTATRDCLVVVFVVSKYSDVTSQLSRPTANA